ncbi:MAG: hypothetical protein IPM45_18380 [Acidimicrobiales bacterium]|nr:hypothetical protein [Acidimicrobiales bacterium]
MPSQPATTRSLLRPLYRAAFGLGVTAAQLDACQMWQVAAMLDLEPRPHAAGDDRTLIRQRLLAAKGRAPAPRPEPTDAHRRLSGGLPTRSRRPSPS